MGISQAIQRNAEDLGPDPHIAPDMIPAANSAPNAALNGDTSVGAASTSTTDTARGCERETFVLRLAELLHRHGMSTPRLEQELGSVAQRLAVVAQFLVTPTSLFVSFGNALRQRAVLLRSNQGDAELGKLVEISDLVNRVETDRIDEARAELERIAGTRPRFGAGVLAAAFAIAAAAAARFFGGGLVDAGVAALLSGLIGIAPRVLPARRNPVGLFEPLAAFVVASVALLAARGLGIAIEERVVTLAALIVLVPGLSITIAMHELATRHLVAGASRLAGAGTVLLGLGVGMALAQRLGSSFLPPIDGIVTQPRLSNASLYLALAVAPASFALLFQARRRELPWICIASWLGFFASRAASLLDDAAVSAFCGALAVGVCAQFWARRSGRPSLVIELPSILPLVPGALGLKSFDLFLASNPSAGVAAAFETALVAASLVGGLLVAYALIPDRRVQKARPV